MLKSGAQGCWDPEAGTTPFPSWVWRQRAVERPGPGQRAQEWIGSLVISSCEITIRASAPELCTAQPRLGDQLPKATAGLQPGDQCSCS